MGMKISAAGYLAVVYFLLFPVAKLSSDELNLAKHPGHLEPLGSQNTKRSLETISDFLTPVKFFETYVAPVKPVLIRGGAKLSPAFTKWNDEYFLSFAESSDYKVVADQRKKEVRTNPPIDISLKEFVQTYKKEGYLYGSWRPSFSSVSSICF